MKLILIFYIVVLLPFGLFAQSQNRPEYLKKDNLEYHGLVWMVPAKKYYKGRLTLQSIERVLRENSYIDCLYIHSGWDDFEPIEGRMKFEKLDQIIKLAHKYNKPYKLTLVPGTHSPGWVYDRSIRVFKSRDSNPHHRNYGKKIRFPLPWDKTYLETWFSSVGRFLKRYKNDPYFVAVTLAGPSMNSPEWHLAKNPDDMKNWKKHGDFKGKIRDAWIETMKKYASILTHQHLILEASSTPVLGMEKEAIEIIEFGVNHFPTQFTLQTDQLNGRRDQMAAPPYRRVFDYRKKIYVGFQNLAFLGDGKQERQGTFEMTVFNYVQAEANYLELWFSDGRNLDTSKRLKEMIRLAEKMGIEKYKALLIKEGKYNDQPDNYYKESVKKRKNKT